MPLGNGHFVVIANTIFTPISLSWNLDKRFFADLAFTVVGPDGSRWPSSAALAPAQRPRPREFREAFSFAAVQGRDLDADRVAIEDVNMR